MKRTFVANAELADAAKDLWIVTIPEIDAATQGYGLDDARLMALSRSMAANYAQFGIRVNVISPGMVRSERILRGSYGVNGTLNTGDITPVSIDFARYPFAVGDPVDLANVALFLASDESRMITGANIDADGGMSAY